MSNLVKIELSIDVLKPQHVKALNAFLEALGPDNGKVKTMEVKEPEVVETIKAKKAARTAKKAEEPKAEEKIEKAIEEPKAEEPKAEEPKAEEPKAEEPKAEEPKAEPSVDRVTIRAEWAKKMDGPDNKNQLKAKLNDLGVNNLTSLAEEHFDEVYEFIKNLKA